MIRIRNKCSQAESSDNQDKRKRFVLFVKTEGEVEGYALSSTKKRNVSKSEEEFFEGRKPTVI
jgi:hypothetical protein